MGERWWNVAEARALLPAIRARADQIIRTRAELAHRAERLQDGDRTQTPEVKALEARMVELVDWFVEQGIEVKGYAPLLIDFPSRMRGREILLCWLENEPDLAWYHDPRHGFLGRRPLAELEGDGP